MKIRKPEDIKSKKRLGQLTVSPIGLRRMANAIQKKYKTNGDVKLSSFICSYKDKVKTLGVDL